MALTHRLHTTTHLDLPRAEVFDFFADAENLERITPPELAFEITSPRPIEIEEGALIDYRLGLFGVRFGWRTEIVRWGAAVPVSSTSRLRGPYRRWHHTHSFVEVAGEDDRPATRMDDVVLWEAPALAARRAPRTRSSAPSSRGSSGTGSRRSERSWARS